MRAVEVDPEARTARAAGRRDLARLRRGDPGARARRLPAASSARPASAASTLGGGIGHLTAQHGLTCDNLLARRARDARRRRCARGRREPRAPLGPARRRRQLRRRDALEFHLHPRRAGRRRAPCATSATASRDVLRLFRDIVAALARATSTATRCSGSTRRVRRAHDPRPATRARPRDAEELRRAARGARPRRGRALASTLPRAAAHVRPALRREPPLLEGPLRARAARRADRRAARAHRRARPARLARS